MAASMLDVLQSYWSVAEVQTNAVIFLNLLGAMLLGLLLGYERSYHGRAAGMRTYALVCMASAAVVVVVGHPAQWWGGHNPIPVAADPGRAIQGVVTGVGFLCAGVIMKEGLNISGLTTAASIWAASAIGVVIGIGFYAAAISLALLCAICMMWGSRLEAWLPSHPAVGISLRFAPGESAREAELRSFLNQHGYQLATGSITVSLLHQRQEWQFVAVADDRHKGAPLSVLASGLAALKGIEEYRLQHARN